MSATATETARATLHMAYIDEFYPPGVDEPPKKRPRTERDRAHAQMTGIVAIDAIRALDAFLAYPDELRLLLGPRYQSENMEGT